MNNLPPLASWRTTRDSLHTWSRILSAVRAELEPKHPNWWHTSLRVDSNGLTTGRIGPSDHRFELRLDLVQHALVIERDVAPVLSESLTQCLTATELGSRILAQLGSAVEPSDQRWRNDEPRSYRPTEAETFLRALRQVSKGLENFRQTVDGDRSPVQLWAHHFDLSFELFGARQIEHQEGDRTITSPAQIGFGWSTGDDAFDEAYFYANPWPFDNQLTQQPLPSGARWLTDPWPGSVLPFREVQTADASVLAEYLEAVRTAAAPNLARPSHRSS